ncbi:cytochrome C oxidase subunit IV family protein [Ferribacterium limneticum]|uniref:cytochrome C oxidase subunit IV family protein n=1 Tax=Ferribacterium limneticum TaxID=76259 RepID=UPI001CF909FB|nr:cytochrome C oxidase subunit IV family protein [Ferribacterium limneticum]UCV23672.1 cytochrome C oxidase subunit IV family protein [Ferribacterium limneticum]
MIASLLRARATLVWFLLVAATTFSWEMGHGAGFSDHRYASIAIIVMAFIKVRYVLLDFMEIRNAPTLMRLAGETWLVVICSVLVFLYWQGANQVTG